MEIVSPLSNFQNVLICSSNDGVWISKLYQNHVTIEYINLACQVYSKLGHECFGLSFENPQTRDPFQHQHFSLRYLGLTLPRL